jgi:hypothetical protein
MTGRVSIRPTDRPQRESGHQQTAATHNGMMGDRMHSGVTTNVPLGVLSAAPDTMTSAPSALIKKYAMLATSWHDFATTVLDAIHGAATTNVPNE